VLAFVAVTVVAIAVIIALPGAVPRTRLAN
jgi:hypothetical protein